MRKALKWVLGVLVGLALVVTILSYLIHSDMLRDYVERQANSRLKGYTVRVGSAYFHPLTFALDLRDLALIQNANPKPPVASIGRLYASVHWRELLRGHVVGDIHLDRPKLYIDLGNVREEEKSKVPLKQKGWQEALFSIYPLKVNVFTISDGDLTYVDEGPFPPLHVNHVDVTTTNIRNIRYTSLAYPSPVHLEGTMFEKGKVVLDGNANFLAEPHVTVKASVKLDDMALGPFRPITNRQNVSVEKGLLSAEGSLEYAEKTTEVALKKVTVTGVAVTYIHLARTASAEGKRVKEAGKTAKELSNEPTTKLSADLITVKESSFGYLDKSTNPNYRLYIQDANFTVRNFSNQLSKTPSTFELKGKFMGSGATDITGSFVPHTKTPDLRMNIKVVDTQMTAMTDLFRVYGKFDIKAGLFSLYSEVAIKGDKIQGYVKPLFRDMQVTDLRTPEQKGIIHKLYIAAVKVATKILKNKPRKEVATEVDLSGTIDNPRTSLMQIIGNLIKNAFFQAILPGFEREAKPPKG